MMSSRGGNGTHVREENRPLVGCATLAHSLLMILNASVFVAHVVSFGSAEPGA